MLAEQVTPEWKETFNSFFPDQLFEEPTVRSRSTSRSSRLRATRSGPQAGQSDVADSTAVHVPDLDSLVPGDVIYNGIHPWMYHSDHAQRMDSIETVNAVKKLGVKTIIAGHTDPAAREVMPDA